MEKYTNLHTTEAANFMTVLDVFWKDKILGAHLSRIGQEFLAALYARDTGEMKMRRDYENELDKASFVKLCVITPRAPKLFLPLLLKLTSRERGRNTEEEGKNFSLR
jgi:hypothetical protein